MDYRVDLIFIDSAHEYGHVKSCMAAYADRLRPKFIVFDDIYLNDSMQKLWREIEGAFGDNALDISNIVGQNLAGFGIIDWGRADKNFL